MFRSLDKSSVFGNAVNTASLYSIYIHITHVINQTSTMWLFYIRIGILPRSNEISPLTPNNQKQYYVYCKNTLHSFLQWIFLWIKSCRIHDNAETSNLLQTEEHYSTTRETLMSIENGNSQIKCKTFINYF